VTVPDSANREVNSLRISIVHMKIRDTLYENLKAAKAGILKAAAQKPAFIALPEYFSVPGCMQNFTDAEKIFQVTRGVTLEFLMEVSMEIPGIYLLGGTVLDKKNEKLYNTSTLWKNGLLIGKYRKKNPIAAEIKAGVARGNQAVVIETEYCKVGLIICADMF